MCFTFVLEILNGSVLIPLFTFRLITALRATPIPAIEEAKLRLVLDLEKNSCCAIAEYIPSKGLNEILSVGEVDRQRLCYQIGQTIVLDMLCNNGDR